MTTLELRILTLERILHLMKRRTLFLKAICFCLAAAAMLSFCMVTSAAADVIITPVEVRLDGVPLFEEGQGALLVDAVTYVPLRAFCNSFGESDVSWDPIDRSATVKSAGLFITAREGQAYITVNDRPFYTGRANLLIGGSVYIPVRGIAKAYGLEVTWQDREGGGLGFAELASGGKRAEHASDVYDSEVLYWLSRIISAESRGESLAGQIAVGNVVLNRTRAPSFPDTVYDVIFDTKYGVQFTPISNGTIYDSPAESSIIAAKICLEGYSLSDDILYFLNEAISTNMWVSNNRTFIMTLGNHSFYS